MSFPSEETEKSPATIAVEKKEGSLCHDTKTPFISTLFV